MFTSEDFAIIVEEANNIFSALPQESRFVFKWYKGAIKPLGANYSLVYDAIPSFMVPGKNSEIIPTEIGKGVRQSHLEIAIPKRFGETIYLNGITYTNGVQEHDMLTDNDGKEYIVTSKQRRGYGAYYVLVLQEYKGLDNSWIEGQNNV
jgi:hypothetical protein